MEALVRSEVDAIVKDHREHGNLDGLIYIMGMKRPDLFLPLYIGKAETLGRGDKNFSANLANLSRDTSKFARWGDGYAYYIGDLSGCALLGHPLISKPINTVTGQAHYFFRCLRTVRFCVNKYGFGLRPGISVGQAYGRS